MQKFIIWLKINWIKILLISAFCGLLWGMTTYIFYISQNFKALEGFSKTQIAGTQAMYLPMMVFAQLLTLPFLFGMYYYIMKGGGIGTIKKTRVDKLLDVKWTDVIGMEEAKKDAQEVVRLLKDHSLRKVIGGNIIKGAIIIGPPGCGKTYLAKAMASDAGLPMLSAAGSDFVAMFMGQGAARMKSLFKQAREEARIHGGCIVFIDEIDAFARPRQQEMGGGATTSHNATINQFLTEFDGLRKKENNIIVLAATNVEEDELDPAIMRSGRFDRKIYIEKPTAKEREALIQYYLTKVTADKTIDIKLFAEKAQWFSPSDINNMIREASVIALRNNHNTITAEDLHAGLQRVISSIEKMGGEKILSQKVNIKWDQLIGMEETKKDAWEIVELLRDRHRLKVIGGQIIKGVIMIGPPGCGKTYLAKAMATESGFPFMTATGGEFTGKYWGSGVEKIKELFKEARKLAKAEGGCIIFIDEIDALIRPREQKGVEMGGDRHSNMTVNQFLAEMDGLKTVDEGNVIVLAATNIDEGNLDEAVLRSGRFDRKIYFSKPSTKDREKLLEYYLSKIKTDGTIDIPKFADKAKWFSAADINNMVRESGILALREKREIITMVDLEKAMKRVMTSIENTGENKILGGKVDVKWDDVIGMNDAKEEAWEIVKLLKDRNMLKAVGGKIVKGVIMFGPPGCGKTYLAKAMATEAGFPFMSAVGSDLVGIFVGEGAKKMKDIFKEARAMARAEGGCIIFFDEIDSFATPRQQDLGYGGIHSHNATVNQFLTELDGLRQQENNIFVLAATNVKEKDLDPAILRAGRIERKIYIKRPNIQERTDLFKFYLAKVKVDERIDPKAWARIAVGLTPSEIDSLIREAGLLALRNNRDTISHPDMTEAYDRITIGSLSNSRYSEKEKIMTAYHEAGHAIMTYLIHPTDEVIKATIRARKDYLGYIYYREGDDLEKGASNKEQELAKIKISIAGYAAEKIVFGTVTTGVFGDFQHIMAYAHQMVWELGMGKSGLLGNFLSRGSQNGELFMSEKTKEVLDNDVQDILQSCLKEATETLSKHRDVLDFFTQELLKKGDLQYDEIVAIFDRYGLKPASRSTERPSTP